MSLTRGNSVPPVKVAHQIVPFPPKFERDPMELTCPHCYRVITTTTTQKANTICVFLFGLCALCFCQDVEHKCPKCNFVIGTLLGHERNPDKKKKKKKIKKKKAKKQKKVDENAVEDEEE